MKLYLFLAAIAAVFVLFVYYSGYNNAMQRCRTKINENITQQQSNIIEIQRKINAEVINRGVGDMRRVLREKYTVAK